MYLLLKTALFSNTLLLGFGRFNFNSTIPPEECQTKARLPRTAQQTDFIKGRISIQFIFGMVIL